MLASLLPGLRELRAPLAAGYLWLVAAFFVIASRIPDEQHAHGLTHDVYTLKGATTAIGLGVALSFAAYLLGTLSAGFMNPLLRRVPATLAALNRRRERWLRRASRPAVARRPSRSWFALRDLAVEALRVADAILGSRSLQLAALVQDELPPAAGREGAVSLVASVHGAVAGELDLVKTRLLGDKAELYSAVDRHQAEAEFRLAVLPPLAVLAIVIIVEAGIGWVAAATLVAAVAAIAGLCAQAFEADRSARDLLVDALRLHRVESPTIERLTGAARQAAGLGKDADVPNPPDRADVIRSSIDRARSAAPLLAPERAASPTARNERRVAANDLARIEVYLPHASALQQTVLAARRLLDGHDGSTDAQGRLEQTLDAMSALSVTALEDPGEFEELASDTAKLRAAFASGDAHRQQLAALAVAETVLPAGAVGPALEVLADAARDAELPGAVLRPAFLSAVTKHPDAVRAVSWRGAQLARIDLAGQDLSSIDLREADLSEANLTGATLTGSQLHGTRLVGAQMDGAMLRRAQIVYTDLAGASLQRADLSGARVEDPLVKDLQLSGARLREASVDPWSIPWNLIDGWAEAELNAESLEAAHAIGGSPAGGPKVLMLSWEAPPLVAGGSWTACWHLVRSLRARGADITVVTPWARDLCEPRPFGSDVTVEFAGIEPVVPTAYVMPGEQFPPYLPYSSYSPYWWIEGAYGARGAGYPYSSAYGLSAYASPYGAPDRAVDRFAQWLQQWERLDEFDLIHAHDWVTFMAAGRAAAALGLPWIAHFHSTAAERRPNGLDRYGRQMESAIEREAARSASALITPSEVTWRHLREELGGTHQRIEVIPNSLATEGPAPVSTARFETKRVVFTGRLAYQKGPDLFVDLARAVSSRSTPPPEFDLWGAGELREDLRQRSDGVVNLRGALPWPERGKAFEDASVVVVPSRSEPFGMVVAEAMQRGVPVIYPADAGIAEAVEAGVKLASELGAWDADGAAGIVETLLADEAVWREASESVFRAIREFAAERHEEKVEALWAELAAGAARSGDQKR